MIHNIIQSNVHWYTMVGTLLPILRDCERHGFVRKHASGNLSRTAAPLGMVNSLTVVLLFRNQDTMKIESGFRIEILLLPYMCITVSVLICVYQTHLETLFERN